MAQHGQSNELVTLQELAASKSYEMTAFVAVLERKGILTQQEVMEEIARMRRLQ